MKRKDRLINIISFHFISFSGGARGWLGKFALPPPPTLSEIKKNVHFPIQSGQNRLLFERLAP